MLCDTCWLAEFQRRVEKDRSSRGEKKREREREMGKNESGKKEDGHMQNKGIKD